MKAIACLCLALVTLSANAGTRTSSAYTVSTDVANAGGKRSTSAAYTNDGSVGDVTGISTVAAPAETVKSGYVGQLYEVASLQVAASPATVNEGAARQLTATATLDDASTTVLLGADLNWSVVNGPITGVNSNGLAAAGNVYQDTAATVQGSYAGLGATLGLTVLNVGTDDFGIYAGDGLPDAWQVQYFGVNNPLGLASADATGTGQSNLFKYIAGLNPTDHSAFFRSNGAAIAGQAGKFNFSFSPIISGRTYLIQYSDTLNANSWQTLTGFTLSDNGNTRTITDNNAPSGIRFYRVQVSYP